MLDASEPNFEKTLDFAIWSTHSSADYRNDRERPYDGQPQTYEGERGKAVVAGLTFRDVMDCFVKAYLRSSLETWGLVEDGKWRYQDVYKAGSVDPLAVGQNLGCEIEKMMGIFPNVNPLHMEADIQELLGGGSP